MAGREVGHFVFGAVDRRPRGGIAAASFEAGARAPPGSVTGAGAPAASSTGAIAASAPVVRLAPSDRRRR